MPLGRKRVVEMLGKLAPYYRDWRIVRWVILIRRFGQLFQPTLYIQLY